MNAREFRRKRGFDLLKEGWKQSKIAEALGVCQGVVSQWKKRLKFQGYESWKDKPIQGAPSKLNSEEEQKLKLLIQAGAESYGFVGDYWTHKRVSRLIQETFNHQLSPKQSGRLLRKLGFTRQQPQLKSRFQNQQEVADWKTEKLPALKKSKG